MKVLCNERWTQRAFENLLLNALKYTPEGGKVEIEVVPSAAEEAVEVIFRDNGIGIFPEDLPKIFEPFTRGRNAAGEKGIGLGLSLVKEVVDLHGAKIVVESAPGKGSRFSIRFPVRRTAGNEAGTAEELTNNSHTRNRPITTLALR